MAHVPGTTGGAREPWMRHWCAYAVCPFEPPLWHSLVVANPDQDSLLQLPVLLCFRVITIVPTVL